MQQSSGVRAETEEAQALVGERYRIEATLGQGGMAVVYQVFDPATGRRLALKRLRAPASQGEKKEDVTLFEREFLTLANLVHPRVVAAYDYGVDEVGPYYTMELLDGGDLQRLAPMDWRRACALLRDVCSALSLLHSRRMIYRDLSPRNIRCTSDGMAKLIDFGAMSPMGTSRHLVGTLPFCAPETIRSLPLDARTDLYALGATLYYTLVGRHAYPARDSAQLIDLWQSKPPRPSEFVAGIPEALDCLVMDLMDMDPAVRPASAAEVIERLSAIAELTQSEQLQVSQAYLAAPLLVGREVPVVRFRRMLLQARRRRGASLLVKGAPGLGRSRFLDACVLDAKLAGYLVLRADATDGEEGAYGAVRALALQLLEAVPDLAFAAAEPRLKVLGHVMPELLKKFPSIVLEPINPQELAPYVQPALRAWLLDVSRQKRLMIAVDDLHAVDEPSQAFMALLAHEVSQHSVIVAATTESGTAAALNLPAALKLFADATVTLKLTLLDVEQARQLLSSVFGDVPNLELLAHRLFAITSGNPRDIMRLAQHLVNNRVVRYQAGAWSVPERIDAGDLPSSMAQALKVRIDALPADSRELARTMAYEPRQRFSFEECQFLTGHREPARLMQSLDELLAAQILRSSIRHYGLGQQAFTSALKQGTDQTQESCSHLRLAEVFERRHDGFRLAQHLVQGGEIDRGLTALIEHSELSQKQTDNNPLAFSELLQSLPEDWLTFCDSALRLAEQSGRSPRELYLVRNRLSGLSMLSLNNASLAPHLALLIEQLHRDSGLDIYAALDDSLGPAERLGRMFQQATERYNACSEADRVLAPKAAVAELGRSISSAVGLIAFSFDYAFWRKLPSLAPLEPVSPALGVVARLAQGIGSRITGRTEQALALYRPLLERIAQADGAGIEPSHKLHIQLRVMGSVGIHEAAMGLPSSLTWADQIKDPLYETTGVVIRMLYHLWQGNTDEAERCRRQVEILRIQNTSRQGFDGQHLCLELSAHALADDLTRVKRTIDAIEPLAEIHAGWAPALHYGRGEHHRIRGDYSSALLEFETALSLMEPGCHQVWPHAAGGHVRALFELGRPDDAKTHGEAYVRVAEQAGLGYAQNYLRMPLALVHSKLLDHTAAAATAEAAIDSFKALGTTGLNLAVAYEIRALLARNADDDAGFARYAALSAEHVPSGTRRLVGAKYERRVARPTRIKDHTGAVSERITIVTEFVSRLESCRTGSERAELGLQVLITRSGAAGGLLYTMPESRLICSARAGNFEPNAEIEALINAYFQGESEDREVTRSVIHSGPLSVTQSEYTGPGGVRYVPVLLNHQATRGIALTGVALLIAEPHTRLIYPARAAAELSRLVLEAGDSIPKYV